MRFVNNCNQHEMICTDPIAQKRSSKKHFRRFSNKQHQYRHLIKSTAKLDVQLKREYGLNVMPKHLDQRKNWYNLEDLYHKRERQHFAGHESWKKHHFRKQYEHNLPAATIS